ncbi:1-acyl-sn-glycerol-3-phosphate acyltransferases [Modestobacter sp. DSM 44400]|uniref:lysophospholipid acyltransferase family protein n=1 Tax=Modestobacter sp. DSM 44400 TaxID=1550230 RepID=UPI0008961D0C|nr:lysophospholipid acyltransferase family protein [Modestobacter sp. DSM 44400]SDX67447.1 1-acyl-sn-glycerol-3-phosphate acyltransferases [Modestobacter sp. DSM 44400]
MNRTTRRDRKRCQVPHEQAGTAAPGGPAPRPTRRQTRRPVPWALRLCVLVVYPVASLLFALRYRYLSRIPPTGGVLLVANHVSVLDPLACARLVWDAGRVPHFLAKDSVFVGLAGTILRAAGQIPVSRGSSAASSSVHTAKAALDAGDLVVIYPEGSVTRDPDWWPMEGRTGVARLALTTEAVVLPVAQWGPQRVHDYHSGKLHPRLRAPADYLVGEPVDLSDLRARVRAGQPLSGQLLHEVTERLMVGVRDQLAELRGEQPPRAFHPRPRRTLPGDVPGDVPGDAG